ncbi:ATP-binding protein [Mixta gaviniae]|uniref:ATP-binding protein n=1 Tax=Mixta gaviniae TaxID=665914 RepID=UPI0010084208|nr:ATP-binding protein [Mixta gaviniae]
MAKYLLTSISDLRNLDNLPEGLRTNISFGLQTPAGVTVFGFDPHGYDIKNMTIAQLEELAIEQFKKSVNS